MTGLLIAALIGCGNQASEYPAGGSSVGSGGSSSGLPADRPHTIVESEDGISGRHAVGHETPYLCLDASGASVTCPDDVWPDRSELSCDASGCHGTYDYDPATTGRVLTGGGDYGGPSCYTCHEDEWDSAKTVGEVMPEEEEEDDD